MKYLIILICAMVSLEVGAQTEHFIYRAYLADYEVNHLVIDNDYGLTAVRMSRSGLSARAVLSSSSIGEESLKKLGDWIEIREEVRGDTLHLITTFDDRFGTPGHAMVKRFQSSRLRMEVRLPGDMDVTIHTRQGKVDLSGLTSTVAVHAEVSSIAANTVKELQIFGSYLFAHVSRVKKLSVDVEESEVETIVVDRAELKVRRSQLRAQGYQYLSAVLEDTEASIGKTDSSIMDIQGGRVTCSNVQSWGIMSEKDAMLHVSDIPPHLDVTADRGQVHLVSSKGQEPTTVKLNAKDAEIVIDARFRGVAMPHLRTEWVTFFTSKKEVQEEVILGLTSETPSHLNLRGLISGGQFDLNRMRGGH